MFDSLSTRLQDVFKTLRGESRLTLDQRNATTPFVFSSVGEFHFDAGRAATVDMTNSTADGRIAVDAVRFVWRGE